MRSCYHLITLSTLKKIAHAFTTNKTKNELKYSINQYGFTTVKIVFIVKLWFDEYTKINTQFLHFI